METIERNLQLENDPTHRSYYELLKCIPDSGDEIVKMDGESYQKMLRNIHHIAQETKPRLLKRIEEEPINV